jgi:hypothetical protein
MQIYSAGQAAPFAAHSLTFDANSSRDIDTAPRPGPGFQPHATSLSVVKCSTIWSIEPGKIANLFLLKKSPLESVDAYDSIVTVWVQGRPASHGSLAANSSK